MDILKYKDEYDVYKAGKTKNIFVDYFNDDDSYKYIPTIRL